jgi:hypothetical protein
VIGCVDVDCRLWRRDEVNFDLLLLDAVARAERSGAADGKNGRDNDEQKREAMDVRGALHGGIDCRRELRSGEGYEMACRSRM